MPTPEEIKAVEFRQQQELQARRRAQLERKLHGSPAAKAQLLRDTAPMMRDHTPDIEVPEDESGAK